MRPVSLTFQDAITESHQIAVQVEVLQAGLPIATLSSVEGGTVTLDAKAQVRGRLDLTLVDDGTLDLVPTGTGDLLAPYGNELRVSRGITYPGGSVERAGLGVFRIDDTDVDDASGSRIIKVAGLDRSARIIDARLEEPLTIASGNNVATAILTVIQPAYPDVVTNFATTTAVTPTVLTEEGSDRWQLAQDLATAAGLRLYFDGDGVLVLAAQSFSDPVMTLAEGDGGLLVTAGRHWTRQGAFNRVVATGENTGSGPPVRGVQTDDNPLSPTFYGGPFGHVPRFYQSQFIVTSAQAQDAAYGILIRGLGTSQTVRFGSIVLPHLEPDDVVFISRLASGVNENHTIDSLTIPLTVAEGMSGATRAVQTT